jgi:hypothetical protein
MATNIFSEILQWSAFQPLWQRDALRRLFTGGTLTSTDLDALTDIRKVSSWADSEFQESRTAVGATPAGWRASSRNRRVRGAVPARLY